MRKRQGAVSIWDGKGASGPVAYGLAPVTVGLAWHCKSCRPPDVRKTRRDRMRARLRAVKEQLRRRMHESIPVQGVWLKRVVRGFFAYHAVPTNYRALSAFRHHVTDLWRRTLQRRSQKAGMTWERMARLADAWLPKPRILHLRPDQRFAVTHPRWEPGARIAHAGICAGGVR